jgi:hypothetical protein
LLLLVVLTRVLACLAPLLLLLVVLTRVLSPLARLLQWLDLRYWLIALVLACLAPLLLLLVVLTHVFAQLGLCVHSIFAQCRMIAPNSSLQDWHAFALDKEPWFVSLLVYNWNDDSFYIMLCSIKTHYQMSKYMLYLRKNVQCYQ